MDLLVRVGLLELALGALLGWGVVLRTERPDWLRRAGARGPRRILQAHLDYVMMGLILVAVGLALPRLTPWVAIPLVAGTWLNPTLFVPMAFADDMDRRLAFRVVTVLSFVATSGSLVAVAVVGLVR